MRGYVITAGCLVVKVKYLKSRLSGLFYYRRGVPQDLRDCYGGKRELVQSLCTYDRAEAIRAVAVLDKKHTEEFKRLRAGGDRDVAVRLLESFDLVDASLDRQPAYLNVNSIDFDEEGSPNWVLREFLAGKYDRGDYYARTEASDQRALDILAAEERITFDEVRSEALHEGMAKKKADEINRFFRYFQDRLVITELRAIRTRDVQGVIDSLLKEYRTATVKKALGVVRKSVQEVLLKYDMDIINPFEGVRIKGFRADEVSRHTYAREELLSIERVVLEKSHLISAQIVGILLNTGCRCGEVGGLMLEHIKTEHDIPHLVVKSESNRRLKNSNSERCVPLVGTSLKIARLVKNQAAPSQVYAFERYNKDGHYLNDSCAQAVNSWLRGVVPVGTSHSFRHSLRDRLLDSDADAHCVDNVLGWASDKMIDHYGKSKGLARLGRALDQMLEREGVAFV